MRYLLGISIFLFAIFLLIVLKEKNFPQITVVSVLVDTTDSTIKRPTSEEILRLYDFSGNNKWKMNAIYHFSTISDVSYTEAAIEKIESQNKWLGNEFERDRKLKDFQEAIIKSLAFTDTSEKRNSAIYLPFSRELARLSKSSGQKRILVIYSDLMENTPDLSFYPKDALKSLQANPRAIKAILERQAPLPDLKGIEIYIVYKPLDINRDSQFRIVSEFYKTWLEEKGASVSISANLSM